MRVKGSFTGTVSDEPKMVTSGKKPFLSFKVESPDSFSDYPNRLDCSVYGNDLDRAQQLLKPGVVVAVDGDLSAGAYISTKTNKPVGTLKMFVKAFEVFTGAPAQQQPRQNAPAASPAPAAAAPAKPANDDDVPF